MDPPDSHGVSRAPRYSGTPRPTFPVATGLSPSSVGLSSHLHYRIGHTMSAPTTPGLSPVWANPFSLAATNGIEVSLFSSGYLDVSVPQVRLHALYIQAWISRQVGKGFPIRTSQDQSLVASSPGLIAGSNVLHRLLTPSHSPHALSSLITPTEDRPMANPAFGLYKPNAVAAGAAHNRLQAPQCCSSFQCPLHARQLNLSTCQRALTIDAWQTNA